MTDPFFRRNLITTSKRRRISMDSMALSGTVRVIREREIWPNFGFVDRYTSPMARRHRSQCCIELLIRVSASIWHTCMIAVILRGRAHVEPTIPVPSIIFSPQASISANPYGKIRPRPARRGLR
ncbi:hypothetical protein FA13DRAFT_1733749 [Coprinellus micaceus]|uniref:Uncharacterized protein n=1 Tax=Coprinellus micaceus TaxID=71717 RepID=A0A4Y7T8D9_COPMI|nr:hypothetical protein FA13DRAFT_1733749 [Coprinellus micaceus]